MSIVKNLFSSSLGKKIIMAVTGAGLLLFLIGHLVGNLQMFLPPEAINRYGHFLQTTPELLWSARLGLLLFVGLHVWSAVRLWLENQAARPVLYLKDPAVETSTYASRTMLMSGLIIASFVIFHLLHFTARAEWVTGTPIQFHALQDPEADRYDVYAMVVAGFSVWYVSLFYTIAMGLLCLHLSHGIGAMFQSLGLMNRQYRAIIDQVAKGLALVLFCGYVSIPVAVLLGHGHDYLTHVILHNQARATAKGVLP